MSHSIHDELKITLAEAARRIPGHRGDGRLNPCTLTRWIQRGSKSVAGRRVRLEGVRCGGRWLTSEGALVRFMAALTDQSNDAVEAIPTVPRRASEDAERELREMGA